MLKDDPLLGQFFDTPEKLAKWHRRITLAYLLWIVFLIIGSLLLLLFYFTEIL